MKKFLKIDTIIEDVIDWGGYKGIIDRIAMKKWANSMVRKMNVPTDYIDKIILLEVDEFKAVLPDDLTSIVQLAYKGNEDIRVRRVEVVQWVQNTYDGSGCKIVIDKICDKCHNSGKNECNCNADEVVYNVDRAWELSHPEYKYMHMKHYYRHGGISSDNQIYSQYNNNFVLMRQSTHDFFNADTYIPGCLNLNNRLLSNANVEYKIDYPVIRVNKRNGQILLSYLATRVDEDGYLMIPDNEYVIDAIKWHIIEAFEFRNINKTLNPNDRSFHLNMYQNAKIEKEKYMGIVNEEANTPEYREWWTFLEQNHFKVLKDLNSENIFGVKTPDVYGATISRLTKHR